MSNNNSQETEAYGTPMRAQIFYFKMHKDEGRKWEMGNVTVQIAEKPFASGAFRDAFKAKVTTSKATFSCVLKKSKKPSPPDSYFLDCATQMYAKYWADLYNQMHPPKPMIFIDAFVVHIPSQSANNSNSNPKQLNFTEESVLYSGEMYVEGKYVKHSDNFGWTNTDIARGTPHAFSHFTFEASNRQIVIVDLQGKWFVPSNQNKLFPFRFCKRCQRLLHRSPSSCTLKKCIWRWKFGLCWALELSRKPRMHKCMSSDRVVSNREEVASRQQRQQ